MRVYKGSPGSPLIRAYPTSSTNNALTAPAPTTTQPSGAGIVSLQGNPPAWLRVLPFGTGTKGQTFTVRLIGWSLVNTLWVPCILCQFTATIGAAVGVNGSDVTAAENFCDTVSAPITNFGAAGINCQPYSPQNDTPGAYLIDACGYLLFEVDIAVGTATAGNVLVGSA